MPFEFLLVTWMAIVVAGLIGLCLVVVAGICSLSGKPAGEIWGPVWREFRWAFGNAWRFQRDALFAPAVAARWVWRRDERRRRRHRRQRSQ